MTEGIDFFGWCAGMLRIFFGQAVDLDAHDDGELVFQDNAAGLFGGSGDPHPTRIPPGHAEHAADLGFEGPLGGDEIDGVVVCIAR